MKIICTGMNYAAHNKELNNPLIMSEPVIFMKPDTALLKDGKPFYLPGFSSDMQYEAEIVVRIDRLGKNISKCFARRYYHEVTIGIDMTARDLQRKFRQQGLPWELCKSFDNSAVIGDFVPLEDLENDIDGLPFRLDIDGKTVQESNTALMNFKTDEIIEYASRFITLRMGDLIFTGTPNGIGNVEINNHLQGYIGEKKLLDFRIK
ncbi:MAG: fumarylacetoacetate hydrolase family protein [Dysgonamonadaceae bacterium]|jgi:2-keto-4-pentenoate hydratase/2-oxohepta-3-ene-1,7-dioic acid hydratase in catechol pathway|nr:fumarylacetoacetate hydrolase family protein [Dysgonamonadaceae bacterium]